MIFRITRCNFYIKNICISVGKRQQFFFDCQGIQCCHSTTLFPENHSQHGPWLGTFNLPINKTLYNENFGYQRNFPNTLGTLTIKHLLLVSHFCKCRRQWAHKLLTHRITSPFVLSLWQFLPQTISYFLQKLRLKVLTQALLELCSGWKLRKSRWGRELGGAYQKAVLCLRSVFCGYLLTDS